MKRFLVFAFDMYYPTGALDDVLESFDVLAEARAYVQTLVQRYNFVYVWDRIDDVRYDT